MNRNSALDRNNKALHNELHDIFNKGYAAAYDMGCYSDNPFDRDTDGLRYQTWYDGFNKAHSELIPDEERTFS